jgi:hypothetical protein
VDLSRRQIVAGVIAVATSGAIAAGVMVDPAEAAAGRGGGRRTRNLLVNGSFEMSSPVARIPGWTVAR